MSTELLIMGRRNKVSIVVGKSATGKETRHQTRSVTKALSKKGKSKALGKSKSTSLLPSSNINRQKPKETSSTVEFPGNSSNTPLDRNPDICFLCNTLCEEDSVKASIECSNCGVWLHGSCLDLNDNDLCILNKSKVTFHCVFCKIRGIRQVSTLLELQNSICQQINSTLTYPSVNSQQQSISSNLVDSQLSSTNYSGRIRGLVNPRSSSYHSSCSFLANGQQVTSHRAALNNHCSEDLCTDCGRLFKGPKEEHLTVCKPYCSPNQSSFLANGQQSSKSLSLNNPHSEDLCIDCGTIFKGSKDAHLLVCKPTSSSPSIQSISLLEERDIPDDNTSQPCDISQNSDNIETLHRSTNQGTSASTKPQVSTNQHHNIGQRTKFIVLIDNLKNPWLFRNSASIKREFTKHFPDIQVKLAFSQRAGGISIQLVSEKDLKEVLGYKWPPSAFCNSGKDLICRRLRNLHKIVLKNVDPRKTESEIWDILNTFTGFDFKVHRFRYQDTGRAIPVVSLSAREKEAIDCIRSGRLSISGCEVKVEEHRFYFPEEVKCFRCHESGHIARLCPSY